MLQSPMLTKEAMLAKESDPPMGVPTAEATLAPTTTSHDVLEGKATSLRRAATALLVFGMMCARPCPHSWGAWLAMIAAVSVLCASEKKILCRARFARLLSIFAAVF